MALEIKPAVREQSKMRLALYGPSGGGKTWTSLALAIALAGGDPAKMVGIDSEHGSMAKYAHIFGEFGHLPLPTFTPENYIEAVQLALTGGYLAASIDSFSHAWEGEGGLLNRQVQLTDASKGDSQAGWNKLKPIEQKLWNTILAADIHLVVTMRSRNTWEQGVDEQGKKYRKIVGLEPVHRKGSEYEFDVVCFMEPADGGAVKLTIEKSRYDELPRGESLLFDKKRTPEAFEEFTNNVLLAVSMGEPPAEATKEEVKLLTELLISEGKDAKRVEDVLSGERARNNGVLPQKFVQKAIQQATKRAERAAAAPVTN